MPNKRSPAYGWTPTPLSHTKKPVSIFKNLDMHAFAQWEEPRAPGEKPTQESNLEPPEDDGDKWIRIWANGGTRWIFKCHTSYHFFYDLILSFPVSLRPTLIFIYIHSDSVHHHGSPCSTPLWSSIYSCLLHLVQQLPRYLAHPEVLMRAVFICLRVDILQQFLTCRKTEYRIRYFIVLDMEKQKVKFGTNHLFTLQIGLRAVKRKGSST